MMDVKDKTFEEKIEIIKSLQDSIVMDNYNVGYYNGVEMCLSVLENREPKYRTPEE